MKVYKSFTRTWFSFESGEVPAQELESAEGLQFNCMRSHLFPSQEEINERGLKYWCEDSPLYPSEVKYLWKDGMDSEHSKEVIQKFERFMEIVRMLDGKGLVTFRE